MRDDGLLPLLVEAVGKVRGAAASRAVGRPVLWAPRGAAVPPSGGDGGEAVGVELEDGCFFYVKEKRP
jgi:hypothetical protein